MIVKFVDDGSYFVELDGPTVTLKSVSPISASATIQVTDPSSIDDGDYFFINTPEQSFYVWMDKAGDGTADPNPAGFDTDSAILVDISGAGDASAVATAIQSVINGTEGLSAAINSEGNIEVDIDESGKCNAPSDYNTGFIFIDPLDGGASGGIIKQAVPNNDTSIVKVYDALYESSTDILVVLCKVKNITSLGKDVGSKVVYEVESQSVTDFVLG